MVSALTPGGSTLCSLPVLRPGGAVLPALQKGVLRFSFSWFLGWTVAYSYFPTVC